MRGGKAVLLVAALLGLLGGCSAFFETNLYSALAPAPTPKASDYEGTGGLDRLAADLGSDVVVKALSSDPSTIAAIQKYLADTYGVLTGPLSSAEAQRAATLYSDLALKTSGGEDVVNGAVQAVQSGVTAGQSVRDLLLGIIPSDILADSGAFSRMMLAMIDADNAYVAFGNSIPPVPSGVDMGDVAQKALTAHVASFVVASISSLVGSAQAIPQIYNVLTDKPSTIPAGYTVGDPYASPQPWLVNIVHAGLPSGLRPF